METNNVYIMIFNNSSKSYQVFKAYDYQKDAFNDYMDNKKTNKFEYSYKNGDIKFSLDKFDTTGLKQNYDEFLNFIREDNSKSVISNNFEKIQGYCGFANRITCGPH